MIVTTVLLARGTVTVVYQARLENGLEKT